PPPPPAPRPPPTRLRRFVDRVILKCALGLLLAMFLTPFLSMALDPLLRNMVLGLAAPVIIVPLILVGRVLWTLGASFREIRDLARDQATRIIHGLEHAAAQILEGEGLAVLGGLTHAGS